VAFAAFSNSLLVVANLERLADNRRGKTFALPKKVAQSFRYPPAVASLRLPFCFLV
jgi:hypothetical protein